MKGIIIYSSTHGDEPHKTKQSPKNEVKNHYLQISHSLSLNIANKHIADKMLKNVRYWAFRSNRWFMKDRKSHSFKIMFYQKQPMLTYLMKISGRQKRKQSISIALVASPPRHFVSSNKVGRRYSSRSTRLSSQRVMIILLPRIYIRYMGRIDLKNQLELLFACKTDKAYRLRP